MPAIYPRVTRAKLKGGARKTAQGKRVPLPGVKTDVMHVNATDKCGFKANRQLAAMIRKAVKAKKNSDKHGDYFVLGWRLYPNKTHPRWHKDEHGCGCGCGCSA
jgi:hypothetical protein